MEDKRTKHLGYGNFSQIQVKQFDCVKNHKHNIACSLSISVTFASLFGPDIERESMCFCIASFIPIYVKFVVHQKETSVMNVAYVALFCEVIEHRNLS